jgi:hypothetical protein
MYYRTGLANRFAPRPASPALRGMEASEPKRRWFQYSLRVLLVFVTLCAILCSWLAVKLRQARRNGTRWRRLRSCVGEYCTIGKWTMMGEIVGGIGSSTKTKDRQNRFGYEVYWETTSFIQSAGLLFSER